MPNLARTLFARRRCRRELSRSFVAVLAMLGQLLSAALAIAHEGHDHDKPPPLNLPVATRVVAVTPDYELVGVVSGEERLTIFLHRFATGEPVKDAKLVVSAGDQGVEATAKEDGVFELTAIWLRTAEPLDLTFHLTLPDDQDILTGRLERVVSAPAVQGGGPTNLLAEHRMLAVGIGALMTGVLLTLFISGSVARRRQAAHADGEASSEATSPRQEEKVKRFRRLPLAVLTTFLTSTLFIIEVRSQTALNLPSVPATMATDVPQRMADGSLFVPKATQHLLSVRTVVAEQSRAARTVQLVGTLIADPNSFSRVQATRPGRIQAPEGGLAHIGKHVEKGELLGYVVPYIEAADKANIESQIAEAEARIAKLAKILSRYRERPHAVPQVKIDEVEGELDALQRKRSELQLSLLAREEIRAPISGIISVANVAAAQIIEPRDVLFEIVDPTRFLVEAFAHDASVVSNLSAAFAVTNSGERLPLQFAGVGLSLKQQNAPLTFTVLETPAGLSIGKPVTVILQSTVELSGIVLPAASIVRAPSGLHMAWVKTEPERFEPHTVRFEALDGQRVVVTAGLKPDARVVTEGATLLNQIR